MTGALLHFGILAHSAEGASLCYVTFCHEGETRLGQHNHPDVTLDSIAMGQCMEAWNNSDYHHIRRIHSDSVARLAKAGADFFACPDNTSHIALEQPGPALALPGLNIADIVAEEAVRLNMRRVGVIGTRFTMDGPVYRRALQARGVEFEVPEPSEREDIDHIIFDELVAGKFTEQSRSRYVKIIDNLKARGCDGVALVCTEIPLLITSKISPLPILDSTRLLARAAVDVATGLRSIPDWRGGPVDVSIMAAAT